MIASNTTERIISDQIFKISKSDENIRNYLIDCSSHTDGVGVCKIEEKKATLG